MHESISRNANQRTFPRVAAVGRKIQSPAAATRVKHVIERGQIKDRTRTNAARRAPRLPVVRRDKDAAACRAEEAAATAARINFPVVNDDGVELSARRAEV